MPIFAERGDEVIRLPDNIVSNAVDDTEFIDEIFPHLREKFADNVFLTERAILTPLNADVARINQKILDMCPAIEQERLSYDSTDKSNEFFDITEEHPNKMIAAKTGCIVASRACLLRVWVFLEHGHETHAG